MTPQFGTLAAADGVTPLYYALLKPKDFDPAKRYPAIVEVYGGPDSLDVRANWRNPAEQLYLNSGFVLFQVANRGGANRGTAFAAAWPGTWAGWRCRTSCRG